MATVKHLQEILDRGSRGRSDHGDPAWKTRDRTLPLEIEKPLGCKSSLELLKARLKHSFSLGLHQTHHQLVLPACLVNAHRSVNLYLEAVAQLDLLTRGRAGKEDTGEL